MTTNSEYRKERYNPYRSYTRKEIIEQLDIARKHAYEGKVMDLFVFSDDYRYIDELKAMRPEWKLYTLVKKEEQGYNNEEFQKLDWNNKRKKMIHLFAQIEVCLRSRMHLGYEFSCTNNYIRLIRKPEEYFAIVANPKLGRKSVLENK